MAQFELSWNNNDIQSSTNNTNQKALYRKKKVGGAWLEAGFSPANPLANTVNKVVSPIVSNNEIYEFRIECNCTSNGPVYNDNGIQEEIGFACIIPDIVNTDTTSAIGVDLTGTDVTKARFTLKTNDAAKTVKFGPTVANKDSNGLASVVATGLTAGTEYFWEIVLFATVNGLEINSTLPDQLNGVCGPYVTTTDAPPVQQLVWVADQTVCEKEGGFRIEKQITGVSSPARTFYDEQTQRVYVADHDNAKGNVYWFNPNTATTEAHMTYSSKVVHSDLYNLYIDGPKRKIYFVGANTGGLLVYDIASDTTSVVPFGTNGAFSRITLAVGDDYIYCNSGNSALVLINRNNLAAAPVTKAFSSITGSSHFTLDTQLVPAGARVYVINVYNPAIGTIGCYSNDFSTRYAEITLPGASQWSGGYWQTGFFDSVSNKILVGDIGSSSRHVIDINTNTVVNSKVVGNKSGKTNVRSYWTINPITNDLLYLYTALNSSDDGSPIKRAYLEDRDTHTLLNMYESQSYDSLAHIKGTNKLVGATPGGLAWNQTPGFDIDGVIQILDNSLSGGNTGVQIVTTLKQVDANNNNLPTGQVKNNVVTDPDYIEPNPNPTSCPITYSTDCPVDLVSTFDPETTELEWEFSIVNAVKTNPSIAKIRVYAYNSGTASTEGLSTEFNSPFASNYYSGKFTGLGGTNYTIKVRYYNASGVELQNC